MKILITGGFGYIGSCLVDRLHDTEHEVVNIDIQDYPVTLDLLHEDLVCKIVVDTLQVFY